MTAEDARFLLAQREFDEAASDWAASQLLASERFYRQAVTCMYFAGFHAAQGLLAAHGIEAATHEGVQRLVGLHFVVPGRLPKEAGRAMSSLLARRHEADYRLLVDVDESTWLAARADGAAFVAAVREYVLRAWPKLKVDVPPANECRPRL